jgi:hypothetical protein
MDSDLERIVWAALVGFAAWLVKDVTFGLVQKVNEIERREWEYRLKEIYCPLYLWSGLLAMHMEKERTNETCDHLQEVMARAAYVIPTKYYYTLVRILESAYEQDTAPVADDESSRMRRYLYNQIEALNLLLYRSEYAGGAGDPTGILSPRRRLFRLLLMGMSHLLTWLVAAIVVGGGALWLYERRYFDLLGASVVLFLILLLAYIRRRAAIRKGLEQRILGRP